MLKFKPHFKPHKSLIPSARVAEGLTNDKLKKRRNILKNFNQAKGERIEAKSGGHETNITKTADIS